MNFNKILFFTLSLVLIFSSCSNSNEVSDAIPSDAKYVLHINNKSVIEKSEYDIFQNQTVQRGINLAKAFIKDQEQVKLLDSFLKDANSLGINLKNDFYMFTDYKVCGILMGVNDAQKVKEALLKSTIVKDGNLEKLDDIYRTSPELGTCLAWNNDKIILLIDLSKTKLTNNQSSVDVIELSQELLNQKSDKSINSNKEYQQFWENKKDISVFYTTKGLDELAAVDNSVSDKFDNTVKQYLKNFEGVYWGSYISFEKGEILSTNKMFFDSPENETKIKEQLSQVCGNLKGDHLKFLTADPLFVTSINLKGEGIQSYLKDLGITDYMNNRMDSIDASTFNEIIKNINGDVTIAVTKLDTRIVKSEYSDYESIEPIPECFFMADVDNASFIIDLIKNKIQQFPQTVTEIAPSVFSITQESIKIYFGVINNTFFVTNIDSVYQNMTSSELKNSYASLIKEKSAVAFGNIQVLKVMVDSSKDSQLFSSKDLSLILTILNTFDKYQVTVSTTTLDAEGRVEFIDKTDNSLKSICKSIDEQVNKLASSFF